MAYSLSREERFYPDFGDLAPGAGTLAAGAVIGTSAGYVAAGAREDDVAATAGMPLVAWVGFATLLVEAMWRRNDSV